MTDEQTTNAITHALTGEFHVGMRVTPMYGRPRRYGSVIDRRPRGLGDSPECLVRFEDNDAARGEQLWVFEWALELA